MFCTNCGHKLPEGAKFCTQCGVKVVSNIESEQDNQVHAQEPVKEEIKVVFPEEEIEYTKGLQLKPGEKVVMRKEAFVVTHGDEDEDDYDEDEWVLVLTDRALIYIKPDEKPLRRVERIPFRHISQVLYHRGGRFFGYYFDVVRRDGTIDRICGNKRIALWELALNDRFDPNNCKRDYNYYARINLKTL